MSRRKWYIYNIHKLYISKNVDKLRFDASIHQHLMLSIIISSCCYLIIRENHLNANSFKLCKFQSRFISGPIFGWWFQVLTLQNSFLFMETLICCIIYTFKGFHAEEWKKLLVFLHPFLNSRKSDVLKKCGSSPPCYLFVSFSWFLMMFLKVFRHFHSFQTLYHSCLMA